MIFKIDLLLAFHPPRSRFRIDGVDFSAPDDNYLTAFYDRLVDSADRLIGIRIHPATDLAESLIGSIHRRLYLQSRDGHVDVFLTGAVVAEAESTGDQAFGGQIFTSSTGELAVSVELATFCTSPSDLAAIRESNARWVTLGF